MAISRHSIIRLLAAPRPDHTGYRHLGFAAGPDPVRERLDRIPRSVVIGFEAACESADEAELARRLDVLDPELLGFGYEGATMAWTILDAVTGTDRTRRLLAGPGAPYLLLSYIGIGFAMRRLPRRLWRRVLPALDDGPFHPTLSWLAVDGYGFDLAYFARADHVTARRRPKPWPWLGHPGYFGRAVDQGIGRALWFVEGADVDRVAAAVGTFPADRRRDLWAGVGLASTYAGPRADAPYADLLTRAGEFAGHVGLGAVFAARARVAAGVVPDHTVAALDALTGLTAAAAAELADGCAVREDRDGVPAFELWRAALIDRLPGGR
ncbi:DUF1702 family protein [Myceligenerans xiligouense]|uniref:Uncharacterized protein DUF1702 n=1 Tax=Myceligenerans xiligouense TaxID=253184 RepID=A0A3N4YHX6_9MICO|nr:DUF1702 family protein [Myceligenerans xiligouense]RPF19717.1 uncharacterized protein DUF1702 [Myceligenerans xiligouense]